MTKHLRRTLLARALPEPARAAIGMPDVAAVITYLENPDDALGPDPMAARDAILLDSLKSALERDEFEIVYLPVVHKGQAPSLEALLRWRHPKLGLVAPASFIAQAEESGLMLPIGAGVLRGATRFCASLAQRDVRVVVNLSARQFLQQGLVDSVREALRPRQD